MIKALRFLVILSLLGFTACQNLKTRSQIDEGKAGHVPGASTGIGTSSGTPKASSSGAVNIGQDNQEVESATSSIAVGSSVKVGLILGPGALRTFAHVGFVQELAKQKVPVHAVTGFEMGALVAAIYAHKGQPFDVEWQMMKLKEDDLLNKGFISGELSMGDVKQLQGFIADTLQGGKMESSKLPFACPALNTDKNQTYMMSRGSYSQGLPYCLAFPPLFGPYQKNVASVFDVKAASDFLRSKGANYIVYVSVLQGGVKANKVSSEVHTLWSLVSHHLQKNLPGVDYTVSIPMAEYDIIDFSKRREMLQRGQKAGVQAADQLMKKLGL